MAIICAFYWDYNSYGKALPIGAISIIAIALIAITGATNPNNSTEAINDALSGFSNQLIWLIGISIMISVSLNKTGLVCSSSDLI